VLNVANLPTEEIEELLHPIRLAVSLLVSMQVLSRAEQEAINIRVDRHRVHFAQIVLSLTEKGSRS